MQILQLSPGKILNGTRTTAGTIITIPANSMFNGSAVISGSITLAGTGTPRIVIAGADCEPTNGAIVHQVIFSGLLAGIGSNTGTQDIIVRTGPTPVNLDFVLGSASSASVTINGFLT